MLSANSLALTYDSANRLISASNNSYTYDIENTRVKNLCNGIETVYTYNTNANLSQLLVKTVGDTVTKYVYGVGLIGEEVAGSFKTYHFDYRGSTVAITDINGTVTDTFAYDTYGNLISRTGTSDVIFLYNGEYGVITDSNGLLYMRARYYSPELRRFVNADVLLGDINNSSTLNRYAYANGNPISNVDTFGLSADSSRGNLSFKIEYRKDINGIGLLPDGTILAGKNVKESDIETLKEIANMTYIGKSNAEILSMVNEYYLRMKKDTVIRDGKLLDYYTNFEDITELLTKHMLRNEYMYATFTSGVVWTLKLLDFKEKVQNEGVLDLKQQDEWSKSSLYYFNGVLVDADAPGNIMYGYIGKAYGIPNNILYIGAGYAQISAGNASLKWIATLGDDPIDRGNVDRGIDYYNSLH